MSIQEMKSKLHRLIDAEQDEKTLAEVGRILSGKSETDILNELTDQQLAGLEKAREEARNGQGMLLDDFKRKMERKWPQLKSL